MMKANKIIKQIVINALFIALTAILTIFISIPIGNQGGYFNVGDTIIVVASLLFGPIPGAIIGGVGSMIADLFVAPSYAIFTLIIKSLEGFLIGFLYKKARLNYILASLIGLVSIVINYYFVGVLFYESFILPFIDTFYNFIQITISFVLSIILFKIISNIKIIKNNI